jgi:hypothetical protein
MLADRTARAVGLTLGLLLGLAVVWWLATTGMVVQLSAAADDGFNPALAETVAEERDTRPAWLYELPAEPAPPADPAQPAEPRPVQQLAETR